VRLRVIAAAGMAVLMLAFGGMALASARHQGGAAPHARGGIVTGRYVMEGGPIPGPGRQPPVRPLSGTVTFTAPGSRPVRLHVGATGKFTVLLAAGTYQVTAASASVHGPGACTRPETVTVRPRIISHLMLICVVP